MSYVIWDLDNCISSDAHRAQHIRWDLTNPTERYDEYHAGCGADKPANLDVYWEWTKEHTPVFLTGRPICVRYPTLYWIEWYLQISKPILLMRNDTDERKSVEVKREMVKNLHFNYDIFPIAAFDDRPEIVAMYKEYGIDAHQLFIHDPDLTYRGPT